ncbi:MAG TPA: hypothetical protein VGV35_10100 [Bryobacteraceae bacterium]|nr:hypothetical protein [Bryobacteraceae bacterium]
MLPKVACVAVLLALSLAAQPQHKTSAPGWPCVAGRAVDPTYLQLAERTGGQAFLFDRAEADRSLVLVRESHKHEQVVFRATGTTPAGYREFQFPIDPSVESLLISASLQCSQAVTVYRPDGAELRAGTPGTEDNVYRSGRIVIQSHPETGVWRVKLAGAGIFSVVVQARSSISFDNAGSWKRADARDTRGIFR